MHLSVSLFLAPLHFLCPCLCISESVSMCVMSLRRLIQLSIVCPEGREDTKAGGSRSRQTVTSRAAALWSKWTGCVDPCQCISELPGRDVRERREVCQVEGFSSSMTHPVSDSLSDDPLWRVDNHFGQAEPHSTPGLCFCIRGFKYSPVFVVVVSFTVTMWWFRVLNGLEVTWGLSQGVYKAARNRT